MPGGTAGAAGATRCPHNGSLLPRVGQVVAGFPDLQHVLTREQRLVRAPGEGLQLHFGKQQSAWGDRGGGHSSDQSPRQDGSGRELCGTLLGWPQCPMSKCPFGFFPKKPEQAFWPPYRSGRPKAGPEGSGGGQGRRSSRGRIRPCRSLTTTAMPAQRRHGWSGERHRSG